jgi:hypothetical protein
MQKRRKGRGNEKENRVEERRTEQLPNQSTTSLTNRASTNQDLKERRRVRKGGRMEGTCSHTEVGWLPRTNQKKKGQRNTN